MGVKVLLLADTHLGFDYTFRPRIKRRRRGDDFFANYRRALQPALDGQVDLVVHGGDLLYRSKVPGALVKLAVDPLIQVADRGVPVCLVPGNHERSKIPCPILAKHPGLHIFDHPATRQLELAGLQVAVAGFPFLRAGIRSGFKQLLHQTGLLETPAEIRLLCLHEAVEGARVGAHNYTFRNTKDVVRGRDIPEGLAAVLCGHIHRHQILTHDLAGQKLNAPVLYPGSIERTSYAEATEEKGTLLIDFNRDNRLQSCRFQPLPARPMRDVTLDVAGLGPEALGKKIQTLLDSLEPDAVVRLRLAGRLLPESAPVLSAPRLRAMAPGSMNISVRAPRWGER